MKKNRKYWLLLRLKMIGRRISHTPLYVDENETSHLCLENTLFCAPEAPEVPIKETHFEGYYREIKGQYYYCINVYGIGIDHEKVMSWKEDILNGKEPNHEYELICNSGQHQLVKVGGSFIKKLNKKMLRSYSNHYKEESTLVNASDWFDLEKVEDEEYEVSTFEDYTDEDVKRYRSERTGGHSFKKFFEIKPGGRHAT